MNLQALVKKYRTLRSQKSGFTAGIDEIDHYTAPLKSSNSSDLAGGEAAEHWKNADVWDFTAMDGANRLAASIHQSVTSPAVRWAKYAFGPPELQEDQPSLEVLEQIERKIARYMKVIADETLDRTIEEADAAAKAAEANAAEAAAPSSLGEGKPDESVAP